MTLTLVRAAETSSFTAFSYIAEYRWVSFAIR
jgi:hypothetical protein